MALETSGEPRTEAADPSSAPSISAGAQSFQSEVLYGAVALVDALGFKAFRRKHRNDPTHVLHALEVVKKAFDDELESYKTIRETWREVSSEEVIWPTHRASLMSDTVAFVAALPKDALTDETKADLLAALAWGIAKAAWVAADPRRGFLYRGAIAFGDVAMSDSFVIGGAVDEAAEVMEEADAAVVWLTPSALRVAGSAPDSRVLAEKYVDYSVPFRDGRLFRTKAVNPFCRSLGPKHDIERQMLKTFEGTTDVGVAIKEQHTREFLGLARAASEKAAGHVR